MKDDRIVKYEEYIDRYMKTDPSKDSKTDFYETQIVDLEKEIAKRDTIIESLNELIYEKDK